MVCILYLFLFVIQDKYEPYLVLRLVYTLQYNSLCSQWCRKDNDLPQFCEWFEGYGMNKVTHVMELWAAGYVDNSVVC